jgi:hypothetical protein
MIIDGKKYFEIHLGIFEMYEKQIRVDPVFSKIKFNRCGVCPKAKVGNLIMGRNGCFDSPFGPESEMVCRGNYVITTPTISKHFLKLRLEKAVRVGLKLSQSDLQETFL